jgi:hypothetical protein
MVGTRSACTVMAGAALIAAAAAIGSKAARAQFVCDPLDPVADLGWSVVPSEETVNQVDGPPYQLASSGDWFIDRTITVLPFCNYFNAIGIYSMRSYTLNPRDRVERVAICKADAAGASVAVPPYAGSCPPK